MSEAGTQEAIAYKPGTFVWVELATSDSEAGKKFYTQLFGWDFTDNPMGPGMVYTMLKKNGREVGALYELMADMKEQHIPPHWMSYVLVDNADESAAKAKELGGTILKEPFDVMTFGRMAVIQDPTGAVFSLWQAGDHKGASLVNEPGSLVWNELGTNDTSKAGAFYSGLFGWKADKQQFGPIEYTIFQHGERGAGGMYELTPDMAGVPPHWMIYFSVADCDATVKKATELGATTVKPADDIPGVGRFAILRDPQGAYFAVIKTEPHQTNQ